MPRLHCPDNTDIPVQVKCKSFSEVLILASTNPQYDKIVHLITSSVHENSKLRTLSEHVVYTNCSECQNKKTICVQKMF